MNKLFITILLIALLNSILELFLPWYVLSLVCFAIVLIQGLSHWRAFLAGFVGIAISWLTLILMKDLPNEHALSIKMSHLFPFAGHYNLFIIFNTFLGAFIGGLSGLCGSMFRPKH